MSDGERPRRVGIRDLRQNLSIYVDRVKDGETLEVTEHGQPVAQLRPIPPPSSSLERLIAEGKATPAKNSRAPLPTPIPLLPGEEPLSETLRKMRKEEQY
jgi:prevent-host-death family protein